jgi:MFS family permease
MPTRKMVGGATGDPYGRRRIFAIGIMLFALASLRCDLAPDPCAWRYAARAFFRRQPTKPRPPSAAANNGKAAGTGVVATLVA